MSSSQSTEATDDAPLASSKRSDAADRATDALVEPKGGHLTARAVTINRPSEELYAYWRDFSNLPHFMTMWSVSTWPTIAARTGWSRPPAAGRSSGTPW